MFSFNLKILLFSFLSLLFPSLYPMKIDRVILSSDANEKYLAFWPMAAKAWQHRIGIKPTLALIADESVQVDETLGDVIRFKPIPGISTILHAQIIRLLLPAYFENEVCILSDIDMLPLNKSYFIDSIKDLPSDVFAVYRDKAYEDEQFPICYVAAQGKTFKEIFNIDKNNIEKTLVEHICYGFGWYTDQKVMYKKLISWKDYATRCIKLGHNVEKRIDRSAWGYDTKLLLSDYYIDAHMPRPYEKYKAYINLLLHHLDAKKDL